MFKSKLRSVCLEDPAVLFGAAILCVSKHLSFGRPRKETGPAMPAEDPSSHVSASDDRLGGRW